MKLPDLPKEHAQPLEIIYSATWLDTLLKESRAGKLTQAQAAKSEFVPNAPALPCARDGSLRTLVAVLPSQNEAAEKLVRRRYAWRGYSLPETENAHIAAGDHKSGVTLLVEVRGTLVGTLTLRLDSPQGLLAEQTYGEEIERVRSQGRLVGELVRLAIEEGVDWKPVLDALLQATYLIVRVEHSLTDVFIEVNPRHVRFHQRVFGFAATTAERMCPRVGAPSVLMHLDVEEFGRRLQLHTPSPPVRAMRRQPYMQPYLVSRRTESEIVA